MDGLITFIAVVLVIVFIGIPWIWGVVDMIGLKRFAERPEYDYTAALLHWWEVKSLYATQSKAMERIFPWLGKDLSEDRNVTPQDGEIT